MGCVPPLRAVSRIELSRLRSLSLSLVRIMDSARTRRQKSTSRFYSASERSTYQDLELGDSHKQPHKEKDPLYKAHNLSAVGKYPKDGKREIQRTDAFTVSYDLPRQPREEF